MLQPTGKRRTTEDVHTHLVRGGFLMLQPTGKRRAAEDVIPTSSEVGP